jgi:putative Mg2+ transporter-C (MgtC) family protein
MNQDELQAIVRLVLAALLGGLLGWQREQLQRPAGLRTHILVAVAAAGFTMAGMYGFPDQGSFRDPARVAAQVVTGIGFLGAGTIFRVGGSVRGLTTGASIWLAGALGLMAAAGLLLLSITAALLGWFTLAVLPHITDAFVERANGAIDVDKQEHNVS